MLVSHRYRFIYTKTLKTASTSVESYFERFCMPEGKWSQSHSRAEYQSPSGVIGFRGPNKPPDLKWWHHMPAADIKAQLGEDVWNDYFKFCVVRNPFDKCVSAFEHFGKGYRSGPKSVLRRLRPKEILRPFWDREMTFEQFRFYDYVNSAAPVDRDRYVIDGKFCLDDVIRFESLQADIERICHHIGAPYEPEYLPRYKTRIRRADIDVESLYTKRTRQLVKEIYDFEMRRFNYRFSQLTTA